jgi:hypothetical protein
MGLRSRSRGAWLARDGGALRRAEEGTPHAGSASLAEDKLDSTDAFIDRQVRLAIERTYCARVNEQCSLAEALKDPRFVEDPGKHVALFADHGIVHARDVASQLLEVLDTAHGTVLPARDAGRLAWMKAYGVLIAFVHDIGMIDLSPVGRSMHPEYVTQAVLGPAFDDIIERLWTTDRAGFTARLAGLGEAGALGTQAARTVAREMLAMANCHSKSKVPVALLNDPAGLRRTMHVAATTDLHLLFTRQRAQKGLADGAAGGGHGSSDAEPPGACSAARPDAFAWLELDGPARELVEDVVDTLRALRCADALRQRGTVLKTSGSYEVFVDQRSANAVFALRPDARRLYLLEVPDPIAAGEANLSSSRLDEDGNLRVSFHRGTFRDRQAVLRAARSAALIVHDIQADAIGSFERSDASAHPELRAHAEVRILIESVDENPAFARLVGEQLATLNPVAARRARVVPAAAGKACAAHGDGSAERSRYLQGSVLDWDLDRRTELLRRVARSGHRTEKIDPVAAFRQVRRIELRSGERLIEAGTPSSFVYIPLGQGLRGRPLGGYEEFAVQPCVPLGATGVIRGAARNAEVRAERGVALLAIPKRVFLDQWHFTYDRRAFADRLRGADRRRTPRVPQRDHD